MAYKAQGPARIASQDWRRPISVEGWHTRGYLPHFDAAEAIQAVTFRLADSLPRDGTLPRLHDASAVRRVIDAALDRGHGCCALRDPRIGQLVENALLHGNGRRYRLYAWVVMPNHVHTLLATKPESTLSQALHGWKSFTAGAANRVLGRSGRFWQPDYFDRLIRNEAHFHRVLRYIEDNPVKAGLVDRPEDWPFGSARRRG